MRKWNEMHAEGGFWTKAPGSHDIACWLLFGTPCEHVKRLYTPIELANDERVEDAYRDLFANAMCEIISIAATVYVDWLRATHPALRRLAAPRGILVSRRLASLGFYEQASALTETTFSLVPWDGLDATASKLQYQIVMANLRCDALYAGQSFSSEEDVRAFASVVRDARDAVGVASELVGRRPETKETNDLSEANKRCDDAIIAEIPRDMVQAFADKKRIALIERLNQLPETKDAGVLSLKTLLPIYTDKIDLLAAAHLAYGRILGLAYQQKHLGSEFARYPEIVAEISKPTAIWPLHGANSFARKYIDKIAVAAATTASYVRKKSYDFVGTAHALAAVGEVSYC
jgi:hypothetical protein